MSFASVFRNSHKLNYRNFIILNPRGNTKCSLNRTCLTSEWRGENNINTFRYSTWQCLALGLRSYRVGVVKAHLFLMALKNTFGTCDNSHTQSRTELLNSLGTYTQLSKCTCGLSEPEKSLQCWAIYWDVVNVGNIIKNKYKLSSVASKESLW